MISNLVTSSRILLLAPLFWFLTRTGDTDRWIALGLFLLAGFTDIIDGRLARALDEVSRLGAMLDLVADRLLTLAVLTGLIASGELSGPYLAAGVILVARDLVVASFGEAVPGLGLKVSVIEKIKITLQFLAFGLLIAPPFAQIGGVGVHTMGCAALAASALIACVTIVAYARLAAGRLAAD
jgi:CDP-diacylglycerol--glycerol-3-phosphate 3-phosphatidyltransferase